MLWIGIVLMPYQEPDPTFHFDGIRIQIQILYQLLHMMENLVIFSQRQRHIGVIIYNILDRILKFSRKSKVYLHIWCNRYGSGSITLIATNNPE
jgi:hypothetical protein